MYTSGAQHSGFDFKSFSKSRYTDAIFYPPMCVCGFVPANLTAAHFIHMFLVVNQFLIITNVHVAHIHMGSTPHIAQRGQNILVIALVAIKIFPETGK